MRLNEQLKASNITEYIGVNYIYSRCHELVSQMSDPQLRIIQENYPELITIAQRIGEANSMRKDFLKGDDENTTK